MAELYTCPAGSTLIDYSFAEPSWAAVKAMGYDGVLGYLPWDAGTVERGCLNRRSVAAIGDVGLCWGGIWELSETRATQGYAVGLGDGRAACTSAAGLGAVAGTAVFATVDSDDRGFGGAWVVQEYAKGFRDACAERGYVPGIYGSVRVVDYIVGQTGICRIGWQAEAWSAGQVSAHAHIIQRANFKLLDGTDHNDTLKPVPLTTTIAMDGEEDAMTPEQSAEAITILRQLAEPFRAAIAQTGDGIWVGGTIGAPTPAGQTPVLPSASGSFVFAAEAATSLRNVALPALKVNAGHVAALNAKVERLTVQVADLGTKITAAPVTDVDALARAILARILAELRDKAAVNAEVPWPGPAATSQAS